MRNVLAMTTLLTVVGSAAMGQTHGDEQAEAPLRVHGGRLVVQVKTSSGNELDFLLSTGTPMTVFSESGAARAGDLTKLTLGGIPVPSEESQTIPDEDLRVAGKVLDGIIGSNTLSQFNALIDVPGGRLLLKPTGRSVSWDGVHLSEPIRLMVYHGVVLGLEVVFGNNKYNAALDLALPTLVVNERVKTDMHIEAEDVGTLRLGSTTLSDLPVRVRDNENLRRWSPNGDGFVMVGAPIAYDCAISISFLHREMRTCIR